MLADELDVGKHRRADFAASSPELVLATTASWTSRLDDLEPCLTRPSGVRLFPQGQFNPARTREPSEQMPFAGLRA